MFTILKRELRSFLRRPSGIIFIALSFALAGLSTSVNNIYGGTAKSEYALSFLSMALALMLPAVVFDVFEKDRRISADRLYSSLGYKSSQVVLGKMGALFTLFLLEAALLAIFPLVLSIFGEVDLASAYLSLLCFIIFAAAMIAMNVFIAAATKHIAIYLSVSYVASVISFFMYIIPTGNAGGIWQTVAEVIRFLSPFAPLDKFISGALELSSIVYLVFLAVLFTVLAVRFYDKQENDRKYGKKSEEGKKFFLSPVFAIILIATTTVASIAIYFVPSKYSYFDITPNKIASISSETKKYLSTLDRDVSVYVVNADSSNRSYEHMLDMMDDQSKRLNVNYVSQNKIKDKLFALGWDGSYDIPSYFLIIESDKRMQILDYSSMFFYYNSDFSNIGKMDEATYQSYLASILQAAQQDSATYGAMLDSFINKTQKHFCAEQMILSCIEYTALEYIPHPYYVTGHGEVSAETATVSKILSAAGISFELLDLQKNISIPVDANCIIINAPTKDLSKAEADEILSYLKNGGALTLLTNEANLSMPNLMSVVEAYGVSAEAGIVNFDHKTEENDTQAGTKDSTSTGNNTDTEEEKKPLEKNQVEGIINVNHDILYSLEGYSAVITNGNHINISDTLGKSTIVTKLLTTAPEAYIDGVDNSAGEKTLAVAIEEATENGVTEIAWFTGAESFEGKDSDLVCMYAVTYAILWGGEEYTSETANIPTKLLNESALTISKGAQLIMAVIFTAAIPALIAVWGFVKYNKRKKAKINL